MRFLALRVTVMVVTFCAIGLATLCFWGLHRLFLGVTLRVHADESPTASSVAHSGIAAIITLRQACLPIYADNGWICRV